MTDMEALREDLAALAGKLDIMLAREAIRELRARYSWHSTRGDWRQIADLFTIDGVFDAERPNGEHMIVRGRENIFEGLQRTDSLVIPLVANEIIEIRGMTAVGSCTMLTPVGPDFPSSGSTLTDGFFGQYHDEMRCEDGRWLFTLRRFYQAPRKT